MGLEHKQVQYMDFTPSEDQKGYVDKAINKIQQQLPDDTTVHSVLKFKGRLYEGTLRFSSKIGDFIAHAKGKNLIQLTTKLRTKILQQWRHKKTVLLNR